MSDSPNFPGRCGCGHIEYAMQSDPLFVHCCHCTWCQLETGTAFALNALIESERVKIIAGNPQPVQTHSASGKGQVIVRCPKCQIALWSHYGGAGDALCFVRVGTLANAARFAPDIHIYTASKLPWVTLPPAIPAVEGYYSARQYWPQASLDRHQALRSRANGD